MNNDEPKHVSQDNITSEDIKPEGRTDGPKNFGPEFTAGPDGKVRPTRPNEQAERLARATAEAARADGQDEGEVVRQFAGVLGDDAGLAPIPPSRQPVPPVVLASMAPHDRRQHEEKHGKKAKYPDDALKQSQYDMGVSLAHSNKALPLEASEPLEQGYNDAREAMKEHLQTRREAESQGSTLKQHRHRHQRPRAQQGEAPSRHSVSNPFDAETQPQERAEFDAGANLATDGAGLPDDASIAAKQGYEAVLAEQGGQQ